MSTKFILVGGYPQKAADGGRAFCQEIVAGFKQPIRVLVCLFARPTETWKEAFPESEAFFSSCLPNVKMELQQADPKIFLEQVKWANVVYFRGGMTSLLIESLRQMKGWERLLERKTIVGNSAGANALCTSSYGLHKLVVQEGIGLLPLKVLCHFRSDYNAPNVDWEVALDQLKKSQPKLPTRTLTEDQFEVIRL